MYRMRQELRLAAILRTPVRVRPCHAGAVPGVKALAARFVVSQVSLRMGPQGQISIIGRSWKRPFPDCLLKKDVPTEGGLEQLRAGPRLDKPFESPPI